MFSKAHIKYIQSLQHKKFRDEANAFIAEGHKTVTELLNSHTFICKELYALPEWINQNQNILTNYDINRVIEINESELNKISSLITANKVLAVFEKAIANTNTKFTDHITLALDTIQDPGNLGTIIRIADWFAIENIICSYGCADMYNPKVVQSTMGSLGRVNIIYTDICKWLDEHSVIDMYAATMDGIDVKNLKKIQEAVIIIGNESKGIAKEILSYASRKITIHRIGKAESLNAAVATGIILSHIID